MGSQKKSKNKRKRRKQQGVVSERGWGYDELLDGKFGHLRKLPSYVGYQKDYGKEVYSYSDSRTWIDLSPKQKLHIRFSPQGIFLSSLAVLLSAWFIFSFIYRMVTEADKGGVALSMLPSLVIVAACVAILLISVFGGWGKLLRWGYKHRMVRGKGAANRKWHEEIKRADSRKYVECSVTVTEKFVSLSIYGQIYNFLREAVSVNVSRIYDSLRLAFTVDGYGFEFPHYLPAKEYVWLKKAFKDSLQVVKEEQTKFDRKKLIKEIPAICVGLFIVVISVMLIVAHYKWVSEIPPFLGVFFLTMSLLVFCNIFSEIPLIDEVGVPFSFSAVLLIVPPWAYVWIETEIMKNQITFLHILTHCTTFAAGFGFFWIMGIYTLSFAISKAVDYARFGKSKNIS